MSWQDALIAVGKPVPVWTNVLVYVSVAATVVSGADYFFGIRRRLAERTRYPSSQARREV